MAEDDFLNIGTKIVCKTCHGQEIKGEVTGFDEATKMVILSILFVKILTYFSEKITPKASVTTGF